ncbi:MAG: insulinase family protein [Syntrophobacterales bacterium]|nr:insulinase family protein [Syntrophobacterales bacterium]
MHAKNNCPPLTLSPGEKLYGFKILRVEQIPEIMVSAYEIEHEKTGAKLLHLHSADRENLFSIGFRTPPRDSRGVPHILEHSVLAGSERYPLKDVFNELVRGTLQTFINAFTYPDKTIYPVASLERRDFFNLARVYADLVLRPRLLRETFLQEGHHYEFNESGELTISGIVYNEMKGAYSSPETLMYNAILENLFPDVPYAHDSGGNPECIPDLSYEQFREFHRTYYSPTNARFFLYGDIPTAEHLAFLAEILKGFERVELNSSISLQPRWKAPRRIHNFFPIDKDESGKGKSTVNMAWMTAENTSSETAMLLAIIGDLLAGSAASPLRKALIDSGLGEDLSPVTGLERDLQQIVFAVGLRGTEPEREGQIEQLILETLQNTVEKGFDSELIEGTLHQVEFHGREITRKNFPYGIVLMGRAYHTWLYDGDPLTDMNFPRIISSIRSQWEKDPALFQRAVREWLLENPHRLVSVMEPSSAYQEEKEQRTRQRMAKLRASLSEGEKETIRKESEILKKFQTEPDRPEAAAALPQLKIADISRQVETIPTEMIDLKGVPLFRHDIFTNGIAYLDLAFDVSDIPEELQPYLPLLGKLTTEMGAAGLSYEAMAKRIALYTGGLGFSLIAGETADGTKSWQKMILSVKALYRNTDEALAIVRDILTRGELSEVERMKELIFEKKNGLHSAVIPSGHLFAQMAAATSISLSARRSEQWYGRSQLHTITETANRYGEDRGEIVDKLVRLRETIFTSRRLFLNMTADQQGLEGLGTAAEALLFALPEGKKPLAKRTKNSRSVHVGVAIPADVCYVASAFAAPPYTDQIAPPLFVLAKQLSNGFLYRRIRVQGGAYGGFCRYEPSSGVFAFLSYRDPHLTETLDIYKEAMDFVSESSIPGEEVEKAIIGTIGALDRPLDPAGRGYTAMIREFSGLTDALRSSFRERVLGVTTAELQAVASRYFAEAGKRAVVAVFAPEERLRAANEALKEKLVLEKLP